MSRDGLSRSSKRIIRVVPTLSTDAYAVDDVLFTGVEIPRAVIGLGGCSQLTHMFVVDRADQGDIDIEFYFSEKNTAFGTQNATADISAANIKAIGFNGWALLDGASATTGNNVDNATFHKVMNAGGAAESLSPITFLQAEVGSTSVYCHAIIRTGTPTFAADSLDLIFNIED
jgi:hypothetical protein